MKTFQSLIFSFGLNYDRIRSMKNYYINNIQIRCFPVVLLLCMILTGCGNSDRESYYDAGTYTLSHLTLDGEMLSVKEIYPSGGFLRLRSDGTATLKLGEDLCEAQWVQAEPSFRLTFGEMTGDGEKINGVITLGFDDTGLEYTFSETVDPLETDENTNPAEDRSSMDPLSGSWIGRFWYEEPRGEWADYEYRSMAMNGTVTLDPSEAPEVRELCLYNSTYSESAPIVDIRFIEENGVYHCLGGYVMSYPVAEWGMDITISNEPRSSLRDTLIIRKPGDYGHVFTQETDSTANEPVDIIRLSGNCRDQDGAFDYFIELTRP